MQYYFVIVGGVDVDFLYKVRNDYCECFVYIPKEDRESTSFLFLSLLNFEKQNKKGSNPRPALNFEGLMKER